MRDLSRLLRPRSIAVIGGGAWGRAVVEQCRKMGFSGPIWPVHPKAGEVAGIAAVKRLEDLPEPPDAAFVGINRHATVEAVGLLSTMGAGGAVCFASGFAEAAAEDDHGATLQDALLNAAGDMPVLGPNCYGFINALDGALLWPDQHGLVPVDRGVALATQSSNMLINLTMQHRGLPVAYAVTAGNQAQAGLAEIGLGLIEDARVTALGLHVEGFSDLRAWERLSARAADLGKPVVVLKVGKSAQAQAATVSHTASLAGGDAGADALIERLGFARAQGLSDFLETMKLLHVTGPLPSNRLASISCSGGEASLAADLAVGRGVVFPPLNDRQKSDLRAALGPMVALANPLDYHTYIWRNAEAMTRAWAAMVDPEIALTLSIVDFPRADRCDAADWECTIRAALGARERTGGHFAMVASLPELMPEDVAARLMAGGVAPLNGLTEAIAAAEAAARLGRTRTRQVPLCLPGRCGKAALIPEAEAKTRLAAKELDVPRAARATTPEGAAAVATGLGFPVALKGEGVAHKTEAGAVKLNLTSPAEVEQAAGTMNAPGYLVEEMVTGGVAELLVGVVRDPAHGFVLTLAAGGTLTELWRDSASLLIPAAPADIDAALDGLRIAPLLAGWRGAPGADRAAIHRAVAAITAYVMDNADRLEEVEVNPLICTPHRAIAADALIREAP